MTFSDDPAYIIKNEDVVSLRLFLDNAESNGLLEKIVEYFHFDILYNLLDTQNLELIKTVFCKIGYNIITDDDETPLTYAASRGRLECVKFLVENGADVNLVTPEGNFALWASIENLGAYGEINFNVFKYLFPLTTLALRKELASEDLLTHPLIINYLLEDRNPPT